MPERPWKDEFTLLCERCGYVIEGLDTGGACPECGKAIAESLPERRVGTAWQAGRSPSSLVRTWARSVRQPRRTLDLIRIDGGDGRSLARWTALVALPLWPVVMLLIWIEARGIQYFGARRGFRITPDLAWSVCGHGSVGWAIAAVGFWLGASLIGWGVGQSVEYSTDPAYDPVFASRLIGVGIGAGGLLMLTGFVFFEVFAWLGLRRCRFANRVRPGEPGAPEGP
ncbi:MAG: hypothetical protein ACIARR_01600 [Phycisphaerales bacterium JB059]